MTTIISALNEMKFIAKSMFLRKYRIESHNLSILHNQSYMFLPPFVLPLLWGAQADLGEKSMLTHKTLYKINR